MKKFIPEFLRRGLVAAVFGPITLAVIYLILQQTTGMEQCAVDQVCIGIFSLTALAFIAGGMNAIYQIERLPLAAAVLIHGAVLYVSYLGVYLINDWLNSGAVPVIVFTAIFIAGYVIIWAIIYTIIRRSTARINKMLRQKQQEHTEQ